MRAISSEQNGSPSTVSQHLEPLYLFSLAWMLGAFVLSAVEWTKFVYFPLAYLVLLIFVVKTNRIWDDWLNPLCLTLFIGFIRFSIPGLLVSLDKEPPSGIFRMMGLQKSDWMLAHALALMALLGVTIGWHLCFHLFEVVFRRIRHLSFSFSTAVPHVALSAMVVGIIALFVFVGSHASIEDAIYSGEIRRSEIQIGTGKYFYLSLMLIAGSVIYSGYLSEKARAWWIALSPAVIAAISFFVLGGRARAMVPFGSAILLLNHRRKPSNISRKLALLLGIPFLIVFSYVGQVYRGSGVEGVEDLWSLACLVEYIEYSAWMDWGQLHSLASAVSIGPGVLGGQTFLVMLWPLTKFIALPTRSAGVFMVDTLVPYGEAKWGFHATLIGDAYLNFGLTGVLVATILFGMMIKQAYVLMRRGFINKALYALIAVYSMRIFFESIEKFSEMLVVVVFAVAVMQVSRMFPIPARTSI